MDILYRALFSITGVAIFSTLISIILRLVFNFPFQSRRLAKILGFALSSLGVFIFITYSNELRDTPIQLEPMSIENLAAAMATSDHLWVTISDGKWDCNNMAYDGRNTFAVLLNKDETLLVVANFDEKQTCEELLASQPSGRLDRFVRREFTYTANYIDFSKYAPAATSLSLCTYCGRQNSRLGIIAGTVLTVFGMFYEKFAMWDPSRRTNTAELPPQLPDSMN